VNLLLANQAMHSLWMPNQDLDAMWGVTLGLMRDIAPTDALEGMLTAQLVATHNLHMRCHRLAAETESPEKLKDYGNMAEGGALVLRFDDHAQSPSGQSTSAGQG